MLYRFFENSLSITEEKQQSVRTAKYRRNSVYGHLSYANTLTSVHIEKHFQGWEKYLLYFEPC